MNNQNTIRKITRKTNLLTASIEALVRESARRFARFALKETPPLIAGGSRSDHTRFLKARILGMRLPRGKLSRARMRDLHMSKKQARSYFRVAQKRQGEMIGGWARAAQALGIRVPGWIARHGGKHGAVAMNFKGVDKRVVFTFTDGGNSRRTNMRALAGRIQSRVFRGMRGEIERTLRRAVKQ